MFPLSHKPHVYSTVYKHIPVSTTCDLLHVVSVDVLEKMIE